MFAFVALFATSVLVGCSDDDDKNTWDEYAEWREANEAFVDEQADLKDEAGNPVYTRVIPKWNSNAYVLMRWFNDTSKTSGNLTPLFTSTVDVKYYGRTYLDEPFDSSYTSTSPADSVVRLGLSGLVPGWPIAMERMHVGDSVEVIFPYAQGYGASSMGKIIKPYSALKFNIKLVNVAGEYVRP